MKSIHAKGLLITACGVLVISPDGLLTRLITTDHWTMIFWRALFLSFGMWLVINFVYPNRAWQQYKTIRGPGLLMVGAYSQAELFSVIEKAGFAMPQLVFQDDAIGCSWVTAEKL